MGYSYGTVDWLARLGLRSGSAILDLGSQDIYLNAGGELAAVNAFITDRGGTPIEAHTFPAQIPTANVWTRAGFSYACVDVDERPGTICVDLQSFDFPATVKGRFDLVVNAGTTEHLANPVGGFAFAHFACRAGGILAHDVPLFGYGNHGLTNPTPKFWALLCYLNGYEPISASVREVPEVPGDPNLFHESLGFIDGIKNVRNVTWMIRIAMRKTADRVFVPPFDFASGMADAAKIKLIEGSMAPFAHLWTKAERRASFEFFRPRGDTVLRRALRPVARPIGRALGIKRWPLGL